MTVLDWRAIATSERDPQGMFRIQPMPVGINDGGGAGSYLSLLPTSYFARPLDAERDVDLQPIKSCDGIIGEDGEERFVIAMNDGRITTILPDPGKGGGGISGAIPGTSWRASYAYLVGSEVDGKTAGSFFLRVPGSSSGNHEFKFDRADDTITLSHASGHTIIITPTSTVIEFSSGGKITLDVTGAKIEGTLVQLGGSGGFPVVYDNGSVAAFIANVITAFAGLGIPVAPPGAYTSATTSTRA
jgi:hypothetical protein